MNFSLGFSFNHTNKNILSKLNAIFSILKASLIWKYKFDFMKKFVDSLNNTTLSWGHSFCIKDNKWCFMFMCQLLNLITTAFTLETWVQTRKKSAWIIKRPVFQAGHLVSAGRNRSRQWTREGQTKEEEGKQGRERGFMLMRLSSSLLSWICWVSGRQSWEWKPRVTPGEALCLTLGWLTALQQRICK